MPIINAMGMFVVDCYEDDKGKRIVIACGEEEIYKHAKVLMIFLK